jgi:DNA-binding transcriptional LysR family regulator
MDTLQNLKAFLAVAGSGSFSAAARQLGVAPSVVTKRIDQLEWAAKVKLFARSTRRVTSTEAGERFLPRVRAAVAELDEVLAEMARPRRDLEGHLRVKVPTTLTVLYLGTILGRFQAQHPKVSLDVVLTDRPLNPVDEGFDLAVVAFPASFGGVVDEPLCPLHRLVCASPAYLAARGVPRHPRELAGHDTLNFLPTGPVWTFQSNRGPISVELAPKLSTNDNQVLLAAAREGNGVALLPSYVALSVLRAGELEQVLETFPVPEIWVKALVPENRVQIPRVRALLAFLKGSLSHTPPWERTG